MTEMMDARTLIFGEVLFDVFGDEEVLGGAPFNVAWHLRGFGANPFVVSRVGLDKAGAEILSRMNAWGMDAGGIQRDSEHASGLVNVTLEDGEPSYDIVADRAYDYIDGEQALGAANGRRFGLIYHGSLALRNAASAQAWQMLREHLEVPVLFDVNLRPPHWSWHTLEPNLHAANYVKANRDETSLLAEHHQLEGDDLHLQARQLMAIYGLELFILTEGASGASILGPEGDEVRVTPPKPEIFVDAVGAGDAFTAVVVLGLLLGWDRRLTLERAADFGSRICGIQGATTLDHSLYQSVKASWV